jgi:hypothetical protein
VWVHVLMILGIYFDLSFPFWSVWMRWIWAHGFGFEGPNPNFLFG